MISQAKKSLFALASAFPVVLNLLFRPSFYL